jgi:hypothetical protein
VLDEDAAFAAVVHIALKDCVPFRRALDARTDAFGPVPYPPLILFPFPPLLPLRPLRPEERGGEGG